MPSCHKMRKDRPQNVRFHFMLPSHCALEEWFNFIPLCFFFKTQRIITFKRSISEKSNSKAGHTIISEQRTAISKINPLRANLQCYPRSCPYVTPNVH